MKRSASPPPPASMPQVGQYFQQPGCDPGFHLIAPCVERVELFTGGRGWVQIQGRWVEVTVGALLWHVEGDQTTARSDWENPYRCLAVHFRTAQASRRRRVPQLTWWTDAEEVQGFVHEVVRAHVDDQFDRNALLSYTYGRLLFQARRWEGAQGRKDFPIKVQQAVEILETQKATVAEVARKIGWSVAHLHEAFQKHLKTTPHEIALRKRMQHAREKLAATDLPIKQIAADCGFSGAAAFCQAFKARVGQTPMVYRRQQSVGH